MNENDMVTFRKLIESTTEKAAIEEWKEAAEKQRNSLYNYRYDHVLEVVDLARELAKSAGADVEVVTLAAWFHDSAKPGVGGISTEKHGIASAELAEYYLAASGVEQDTISRVSDVIAKHVGLTLERPLEPIEAQVLWEADKILKLGFIGLLHFILNGIRISPGQRLDEISVKIKEFLPLAQRIADSVVTERGKMLARERLQTLHDLSRILESEINPQMT